MISAIDIAGHVGYVILLVGQLLLTQKSIYGWVLRFVGEATWVIIGFIMGMSSMWFWGIVFMGIDIRGFIVWRKKEKL